MSYLAVNLQDPRKQPRLGGVIADTEIGLHESWVPAVDGDSCALE